MAVEIRKVEGKKDLKAFIDFHYDLYKGNQYDAPNLFSDDMHTLRKDKNAAFGTRMPPSSSARLSISWPTRMARWPDA